jgi:hypothetical protein
LITVCASHGIRLNRSTRFCPIRFNLFCISFSIFLIYADWTRGAS